MLISLRIFYTFFLVFLFQFWYSHWYVSFVWMHPVWQHRAVQQKIFVLKKGHVIFLPDPSTPNPSIYIALILLLFCSAFFSASETAITSVNRMRLKARMENGDKKAAAILGIIDDYDRTISTILIGNNVVNLTTSSLSTALAIVLVGPVYGPTVSTVVVTLAVLICGEILPKSYAKTNPEKLCYLVVGPLSFIKTILTPLAFFFVKLAGLFTRKAGPQPSVTEDDLKTIIDTVEEEGVLSSQETDIIQSVIEFDDITVQEILVPRVDVIAVDADAPVKDVIEVCRTSNHTRIPVYSGNIDHITGMLHTRDLFDCLAAGKPIEVGRLRRSIPFVYRTKRINDLLAEFRRTNQQMAVVTDDYGGTLGIVTMEDVLEELVGEIFDETDEVETPVRLIGENLYRVDADVNIYDLFEAIDYKARDFDSDYPSAAGWALECLEHIPQPGESFDFERLHVTVEEMDDKRIVTMLVRILDETDSEQ